MPEEENTASAGVCTSAVFLLSIALFIFAMVVFDEIKNKDLVGLNNGYAEMIKWCISFAYMEIALMCSAVFFTIVGLLTMCCFDNPVIAIFLLIVQVIAGFVAQIVYVALAAPIRNTVISTCNVPNVNTTEMCNFYTTNYNPMVIILIVLLSVSCLNFLIIGCAGGLMCCLPK